MGNVSKIVALDGNLIFQLNEGEIYSFIDRHIITCKDKKYGIIDYAQNTVVDFEWDHLEFIGENLSAGKAVDTFFDKELLESEDIFYDRYFKHFTKDYRKINFGVIDFSGKTLYPFVSASPVRVFNPENGRAKISLNRWEFPDLDWEELVFVADSEGNKIPFSPPITEEERESTDYFHKRCHELIWGEGTFYR